MDTRAALKARQELGEPMTPDILTRVETALVRADVFDLNVSTLLSQEFRGFDDNVPASRHGLWDPP